MLKILEGKIVRDKIVEDLKKKIHNFGVVPNLAIIKIGDNLDSEVYVKRKLALAKKNGINAFLVDLESSRRGISRDLRLCSTVEITQEILLAEIEKLNQDESVNGIIIQSPLPKPLDWFEAVEKILPTKDVDGVNSVNIKNLSANNHQGIVPATARGVLTLLNYYHIPIQGKKVVVMGRSLLVGNPIAVLMRNNGATVTVCHSQTVDITKETREADILIVAIGKPKLVNRDYVKSGQVIIDVGITSILNSNGIREISGDVDFDSVKDIVSAISPVPGGVGPMTVASLFQNLVETFERQNML